MLDLVFHLVYNGGGDRADGDAVFNDDIQIDDHRIVHRLNAHAAAQVFPAHQLDDAIRRPLGCHADDAVAFQRRVARHFDDHVLIDRNQPKLRPEFAVHI